MKMLNCETSIITLQMENNETIVSRVEGNGAEVIVVDDGAERINNEAFKYCKNLKVLYLPKSITFIGDKIFKSDYSEVKIIYEGSSNDFYEIDYEREKYMPGKYDKYPFYSDYGATSESERFYRCYDNVLMWCEVYCREDKSVITFGRKK